jgi:hypothetical protein
MIARAKIRRAQQDKNPYCREHSESNTECGHLLTPDSELCCQSLPQRKMGGVCGKKTDRAGARPVMNYGED